MSLSKTLYCLVPVKPKTRSDMTENLLATAAHKFPAGLGIESIWPKKRLIQHIATFSNTKFHQASLNSFELSESIYFDTF